MRVSKHVLWPTLGLWVALASAEEVPPRQHEAHEHGSARMNVATEQNDLYVEFASPAANIVGFEHEARTSQEKETVRKALEVLENAGRVLQPTAAARCQLTEVEVESAMLEARYKDHETEEHAEGEHHTGAHEEQEHAHREHGDDDHDEDDQDESAHADLHVSYHFRCDAPDALDFIEVKIFELFPGTESIDSQVITERSQTRVELTPGRSVLRL